MLCETGDFDDLKRRKFVSQEKFDGTRVIINKIDDVVNIQNRHGVNYTQRLPELVRTAEQIPNIEFSIDGEAVYINNKGEIEFTGSQKRCSTHFPDFMLRQQYPIIHKAFDITMFNGEDLTDKPWYERQQILEDILKVAKKWMDDCSIQFVPSRRDCAAHFKQVKAKDEEGVVLKDVNSKYSFDRSYNWLKVKNWRFQECSVAGFTKGKNMRAHFFGSLVLTRKGRYCGCVGSGFNDWELRQIKDIFTDSPKIKKPFDIKQPYIAVKTDLKVQVKYYKTTENGVMRFPVFLEVVQ